MISYWTIRARLLRVPGVANVAIWGERLQMLQVQVDPERMAAQRRHARRRSWRRPPTRSTPACCSTPTARVIGTGGFIETPNQRLGDPARAADRRRRRTWRRSPSASADGKPLRLGDVADVVEDHQPLIGDAVINDGPGPDAHRREVSVGQHARGHRAASRRRSTSCGRACTGIDIDTDDLPAGHLHRDSPSTTSPWRCCSAACW